MKSRATATATMLIVLGLFALTVFLVLAWKVAGYYGVDRWLLPVLGTPWHPAVLAGRETRPAAS